LFKGDVKGICEQIDIHDNQEIMEEVEAMDELWKGVAHEHYHKGADEQRKKDEAKLAAKDAVIAEKDATIAEKDATIAEQAATLEEMAREIERLKKR
jgi:hypothetical protein